jgi:hypothetical protein
VSVSKYNNECNLLIFFNFMVILIFMCYYNVKDCNTPILYFNYALYKDFKNNCSAIVNGATPEDGDV